jgi:hypothetical protein
MRQFVDRQGVTLERAIPVTCPVKPGKDKKAGA